MFKEWALGHISLVDVPWLRFGKYAAGTVVDLLVVTLNKLFSWLNSWLKNIVAKLFKL